MDNVRKETHVLSGHEKLASGDSERREGRSSFPASHSKAQGRRRGRNIRKKHQTAKRKALQTKGAKFHADTGIAKKRHVNVGILPCVKITSLKSDAYMEENAIFRHVEAEGKPNK